MERKRNRIEIIHVMLKIIQDKKGKIKKTHLMYKANLSHNQMKSYLNELARKELVMENAENLIEITKKGRDFTFKYSQLIDFERTFGL